jgi:hypothetical protein
VLQVTVILILVGRESQPAWYRLITQPATKFAV